MRDSMNKRISYTIAILFVLIVLLFGQYVFADAPVTRYFKEYNWDKNKLMDEITKEEALSNHVFYYYKVNYNNKNLISRIEYIEKNHPLQLYWKFFYSSRPQAYSGIKGLKGFYDGERSNAIIYANKDRKITKIVKYEGGELSSILYFDGNNNVIKSEGFFRDTVKETAKTYYTYCSCKDKEIYESKTEVYTRKAHDDELKKQIKKNKMVWNYGYGGKLNSALSVTSLGEKVKEKFSTYDYKDNEVIRTDYIVNKAKGRTKKIDSKWYFDQSGNLKQVDTYNDEEVLVLRKLYNNEGDVVRVDHFSPVDGRRILIENDDAFEIYK